MNNLQQLINIAELFLIIVTNPLESITLNNYDLSSSLHSTENNYYIAPDDGIIRDIINNSDGYQVIISLNYLGKVVYSGLSEITKAKGEGIHKGEIIGKDNTISTDTKFILMLFENLDIYPQIKNYTLSFLVDKGTPVYSISDAYSTLENYDNEEAGLYIAYHLVGNDIMVKYQHLMMLRNRGFVNQGNIIAYSGFTGAILVPQLSLIFSGSEIEKNIKIIYWKPIKRTQGVTQWCQTPILKK